MTARCPVTGNRGRSVPTATLRSLLRDEHLPAVSGRDWFFCDLADCHVVYFTPDGKTFSKGALKIRVGAKETDPPRSVCYCFGHTVESIREEIARTGRSTVAASISAKVKAGECSCETLNPEGTCCLGDVRRAVKDAFASVVRQRPGSTASKAGLTLVGSVVAALAASACCIGPVVFALLGVGGAAFAVALEPYRPVFIGVTALLLGGAFYLVYRRPPAEPCGPDGTCRTHSRRTGLKVLLWAGSVIVAAALMFPYYVSYLT